VGAVGGWVDSKTVLEAGRGAEAETNRSRVSNFKGHPDQNRTIFGARLVRNLCNPVNGKEGKE